MGLWGFYGASMGLPWGCGAALPALSLLPPPRSSKSNEAAVERRQSGGRAAPEARRRKRRCRKRRCRKRGAGSGGAGAMPVAVLGEAARSFLRALEQCETQELEAPGGIATPLVYGQLLALYLLHNDMNNARYLWKRIPPAIKSAQPELGAVWAVGQRIWQRDFPGVYSCIAAHPWPEGIQPIMEALRDATRRRAFGLVSQAYTSILAEDFAAFVGLPVEEAVKDVLEQGWQADFTTRMVMPKKPGVLEASLNRFIPSSDPAPVPPIPNEQQLARLTDYVAFLEN